MRETLLARGDARENAEVARIARLEIFRWLFERGEDKREEGIGQMAREFNNGNLISTRKLRIGNERMSEMKIERAKHARDSHLEQLRGRTV